MPVCTWCLLKCKKKKSYKCQHYNDYVCYKCIRYYIFKNNTWPSCCSMNYIDYNELQHICSKKSKKFNKFINNFDEHFIFKNFNMKYCPKNTCGYIFSVDDNCQYTKLKCMDKECNYKWCNLCMKKWKKGHKKKCKGKPKIQKIIDKIDNKIDKKRTNKNCPHCNSLITKRYGCNHMKCSWCKFEFCWTCSNKINECNCPYSEEYSDDESSDYSFILVNINFLSIF